MCVCVWTPCAVWSRPWHLGSSFQTPPRFQCSPWCSSSCVWCLWWPCGPPSAGLCTSPSCRFRKRERTFGKIYFRWLVQLQIGFFFKKERNQKRKKERETSSSRPDYVVVGLSLLSQVHRKALQLLNGFFSHPHVVLCFPRGAALQGINKTFRQVHKTTVRERETQKYKTCMRFIGPTNSEIIKLIADNTKPNWFH